MYLGLNSFNLWSVSDPVHPSVFFSALEMILYPSDVLVLGSYGMKASAERFLECICLEDERWVPYSHAFDLNRDEHPSGRAWHFHPTLKVLKQLAELSLQKSSKRACHFFDHVVAYRSGRPVVPLVCYHDAFNAGELQLSGLYEEKDVAAFCGLFEGQYALIEDPQITQIIRGRL